MVALFKSREQEFALLESCVKAKARQGEPLRILEAGCGRKWPLKLGGIAYSLTGADSDSSALEIRQARLHDLDEMVVGDLRSAALMPDGVFDVVYCSYVLEHVDGAEVVLRNFLRWLKPGGLIILRMPDRGSVYGFVASVSPLWLHVAFKKYVEGMKDAGKPGFDPYPTFYDPVVSLDGMRRFCNRNDCEICEEYGHGYYLGRNKLVTAAAFLGGVLSLGRLAWRYDNLTFVIHKRVRADSMRRALRGATAP